MNLLQILVAVQLCESWVTDERRREVLEKTRVAAGIPMYTRSVDWSGLLD